MILNKKDFENALKFVSVAMSDNKTRRNLAQVCVTLKNGKLILEAANAFIIKWVEVDLIDFDLCGTNSFTIRIDQVKQILGLLKQDKSQGIILTDKFFKIGQLEVTLFETDYPYPDLARVKKADRCQTGDVIKLNATLLQLALKHADKNEVFEMHVGDKGSSVLFSSENKHFVIMPS